MKQASGTPVQAAAGDLSERTRRVLCVIRNFSRAHGYAPTLREIGTLANITSASLVTYHLNCLQSKQLIQRSRYIARGIILTERGRNAVSEERDCEN